MKHYLDVTNTFLFWRGSPTGIQRVIQGLSRAAGNKGFELAVFHPGSRTWYALPQSVMEATFQPDVFVKSNQRLKALMGPSSSRERNRASRLLRQVAKKGFHFIYRHFLHELGMWMGRRARNSLLRHSGTPIRFNAGDRLYIIDANWGLSDFFPAIREEKKKQPALDIVGFVYDITPITHPQFVAEALSPQFSLWISRLLEVSSWILTDSKDAAHEVIRVFPRECESHRFPPRAVRFGSKIEGAPRDGAVPSAREIVEKIDAAQLPLSEGQREAILKSEGWALWVGLLHPRKNLDVQINALEPLWKNGAIRMPLFWVGRSSAGTDNIVHRVTKSPHLKSNVIRLQSVSDSLLWELFRGARFSLYTSWTEGFGLPVSESLQRGCPVIASSGGSIPEVAGDLVEYFDPWDARGLQKLALNYLRNPAEYAKAKQRASQYVPYSWEDTLEDFLNVH